MCLKNQPLPTFCTFSTGEDCRAVEMFGQKSFLTIIIVLVVIEYAVS